MNEPSSRQYLTRKEAADYITNNWFRISKATLDRYANQRIGPPYRTVSGVDGPVLYLKDDLNSWARSFPVVNLEDEAGRKSFKTLAPSKARGALTTAGARR